MANPPTRPAFVAVLIAIARWGGPPIGVLLAIGGTIAGFKARRRKRRRTRGSPANRCAQGWHELIDHARDLGRTIPSGWTRRQEATALGLPGAMDLATEADIAVYGPDDPSSAIAIGYWHKVDAARKAMTTHADRWQRLRAAVSIRSLRPRPAGSALEEALG